MKTWKWQAPPGWPLPPKGWTPPPGWRADPAWPAPPEDWRWWRRVGRNDRRRVAFVVLAFVPSVVLVVLVVVAAVVSGNAFDRAGCGSIDPTDPYNYSVISIVNDTSSSVTVGNCAGAYCVDYNLPQHLAPGQRFTDHAACAAGGSHMTSWKITGTDGTTLGFIAVDSPEKIDGLIYKVSRASPDRRTATPSF